MTSACFVLLFACSYAVAAIAGHKVFEQADIFVKDPNTFICNNRSPIEDRHFSSSKPHIPLTHIFCGEINKGKAQGYHALSIPNGQTEGVPPPSARNDKDLYDIDHNVQCCYNCKTSVLNADTGVWISKDAAPRSSICYFPNNWTKAETVSNLQGMYNDPCFQDILRNNNANVDALNICFRPQDLLGNGWNVWIFLGARNDKNKVDRSISTAFLNQKSTTDGCNAKITCTRTPKLPEVI
ncbi:hypothetical protein EMCRGX_G009380 [Ephydatia muelleri]